MVRVKHRIGRYRLIAPIGAGGFSTVYRALDEESKREVAIKVLAENHSLVPDTRRRFVEEYKLRKTVESPFIAKMFEVGTTEAGQPYMVLELADRGDLRRRVEEFRRSHQLLTRDDLMMLARHLTEALTALHDADIVHRDVSPGNILIRSHPSSGARQGSPERGNVTLLEPGERFLLADLGHAKDLVRSSGFTAGGGTQGFAAPEQRDDVTVVDHRADIFSATAIVEWAAHDGLFAERLEPFFDVGLAAEPDDRYPTMAEWYDAISDAVGTEDGEEIPKRRFRRHKTPSGGARRQPVPAPGPEPGPERDDPATEPAAKPSRTGRFLVALGVLAIAAGGAAAGLGFLGDSLPLISATEPAASDATSDTPTSTIQPTSTTEPTSTSGPLVVKPPEGDEDDTDGQGAEGDQTDDGEPGQLPWTAMESPDEDAIVDGDLVIAGVANCDNGISHVEVTIRNLATNRFWTPDDGTIVSDEPFRVEVVFADGDDRTTGRFEAIVADTDLDPGEYLIQIWAKGMDDEGPAEPATRQITIV